MKELCKELQVWQEAEVRLAKVKPSIPVSRRERNLAALRSCSSFNLVEFQAVRGATAFMHDSSVIDQLELKVLTELPAGDHVFFPFAPADGTLGS